MSGLSRTPGKRVQDNILTGVRIPLSPPTLTGHMRNTARFVRIVLTDAPVQEHCLT